MNVPGYYFDVEKNRYFKSPNQNSSAAKQEAARKVPLRERPAKKKKRSTTLLQKDAILRERIRCGSLQRRSVTQRLQLLHACDLTMQKENSKRLHFLLLHVGGPFCPGIQLRSIKLSLMRDKLFLDRGRSQLLEFR